MLNAVFPLYSVDFYPKSRISNNEKKYGNNCIIAELTGKQHKHVMEAIRKMDQRGRK